MAEIQTTDFRRNLKVEVDGKPFVVIKCDFTNPGKATEFYKVRLRTWKMEM